MVVLANQTMEMTITWHHKEKIMVTGSLQIKSNKYYCVLNLRDEKGERKQKWIPSGISISERGGKTKAHSFLLDQKALYSGLRFSPCSNISFGKYMEYYIEIKKQSVQITTYQGYKNIVDKHISPYFNKLGKNVVKVTSEDIENYYRYKLDSGLSQNTVRKHHELIHGCFSWAIKNRIINENPADYLVNMPRTQRPTVSFYNTDEIILLLTKLKDTKLFPVILVAVITGLRRSELLGLRWSSLNFETGSLSVNNKIIRTYDGKKTGIAESSQMKSDSSNRVITLNLDTVSFLKNLKIEQERNMKYYGNAYCQEYIDYIFVNARGELLKPDYISHTFKKLLIRHGLRIIRFHDLRHSCVSQMVAAGIDFKTISSFIGHSDVGFTMNTYAHISQEQNRIASEKIGKQLNVSGILSNQL